MERDELRLVFHAVGQRARIGEPVFARDGFCAV